ncbi:four helix bundle protein [Acidicapsa ligni]|uniref:four helix bundle protein n=1 Tax=Acidicapsa ligni TaxID=542300 RepID=UPI0021E0D163|nr:four helix bundle protein [Acidicapsa ligni]
MSRTRNYRDLLVWQKAMELAREAYTRTEEFPASETFGLRQQIRRSAVSVPSNIADGHGRLADADLRKFLAAARGSVYEMQTQVELAKDLKFLNSENADHLLSLSTEVAKLTNGLLAVLQN